MKPGADIFTVRTGRATVMIGLPASLAAARGGAGGGGPAFGGAGASELIDLALGACGETHGVRQFCVRSGFASHGVTYVGNRALRDWLVNAVRQGRLAVVLLPDVLFDTGGVQGRTLKVRADFARRIDRVVQSQAGTHLRPLEMIEAMQAGAGQRGPGAGNTGPNGRAASLSAPAGVRPAGGQGRDLTPSDVRAMALEDRMLEVIRRTLMALEASADVRRQDLEPLVAPGKLAGTVAVLTAWADTHQGEVRALTGLALRAFGRGGLDEEAMFGLLALSQALARTRDALDQDGLDKAANRLARAVTLLGPALESLIASSTTLPVAVPSKAAFSPDRTPTRRPPERYWPRPAPAVPQQKQDASASIPASTAEAPGDVGGFFRSVYLKAKLVAGVPGARLEVIADEVNPLDGIINCGNIIDSVHARLTGADIDSTAPIEQDGTFPQIEARFNTVFDADSSFQDAFEDVMNGGHGTMGLISIKRPNGTSHVVLIANDNGRLGIVEGQGGGHFVDSAENAEKKYDKAGRNKIGFAMLPEKFK